MAQLSLRIVEEANIGHRKKEQQDFHGHVFIPANPEQGIEACCLLAVADGVSMGMAGALASRTAVQTLISEFARYYTASNTSPAEALENAFLKANYEVYLLAQDRPGMATTLATALLTGDQLLAAHVGDTRIYLERPDLELITMTTDHSWLKEYGEQMVRQGYLSHEDLRTDNRRHSITRALGLDATVLIDFNAATLQKGDLILLCTDGLWDLLGPGRLEGKLKNDLQVVRQSRDNEKFNELCHELVDMAMQAGGRDNITLSMALVDGTGTHFEIPGLQKLLERTARDMEERTNPPLQEEISPENEPTTLAGIPYRPMGFVEEPQNSIEPAQERTPSQLENSLSRGQQLFALGQWEEGLNELIGLEKNNPGYHRVYEVLNSVLLRYINNAIETKDLPRAVKLHQRLLEEGITRHENSIFDLCLEEGRKAATQYNYQLALDYATFAARIHPQDVRVRNLYELCTLYLELEHPDQPIAQKLAIAQKLYARDPDFGAIQDDLGAVYMQLGDEASLQGNDEDARAWYELIRPLKPKDMRLVSLANGKLKALEDKLARQALVNKGNSITTTIPTPTGLEKFAAVNSTGSDGKPETEALSRLKDRVSRAQKAWDNGRKEVGAEYIYLVDQLNQLLSPNPWQPTFPRVCYDYGKWLLEQRQYLEARPYFLKAQALGMTAAQQRLSEIDRMEREKNQGARGQSPVDLPSDEPPSYTRPANTGSTLSFRQPMIDTGKGNRPGEESRVTQEIKTVAPPQKGTTNGNPGTASDHATFTYVPPVGPAGYTAAKPTTQTDRFTKPERLVGVSGTLRNLGQEDPLQNAAMREAGRIGGAPVPQSIGPTTARPPGYQPRSRFMEGVGRLWFPILIGLIIGLVALVVLLNVVGRFGQSNSTATQTALAAATGGTTVGASSAATTVALGPGVTVHLTGIGPDLAQVYLAKAGEDRANWRELSFDPVGAFQLTTSQVSALDPQQKYSVVVVPKDTATRKYRRDLPLDNPIQTLFVKNDLTFSPSTGLDTGWKLAPEAFNFYPVAGGDADANLPTGGRYIAATHHTLQGDFMRFYDTNGGLARYGFPISEEFNWDGVGQVQFFERGWLVQSPNDKLIKLGKLGTETLGLTTCSAIPRPPAGAANTSPKADAAFANFVKANQSIGAPISPSFEVTDGNAKKLVQYFEFARLEISQGAPQANSTVNLGLLGSEYARCQDWYR